MSGYAYRESSQARTVEAFRELEARYRAAIAEVAALRKTMHSMKHHNGLPAYIPHPGNGDFGEEAYRIECEREYAAAVKLGDPVFYDPADDKDHPRRDEWLERRESAAVALRSVPAAGNPATTPGEREAALQPVSTGMVAA